MLPIIFLAFANSSENPLTSLTEEDNAVYDALSPRAFGSSQHYRLHRDSYMTHERIARDLMLFRDFVMVFHFSGHAGADILLAQDGLVQASGIAYLLSQCKRLKLVVLNGCSTEGQVNELLERGIPAVIATSAPVGDKMASSFSSQFYAGLSKGYSVKEAFEFAKGTIMMTEKGKGIVFRDIFDLGKSKANKEQPVWGLFCREENAAVLEENLPSQTIVNQPEDYQPNIRLQEAIWKALANESPQVKQFIANKADLGVDITGNQIRMEIVNNLPAPIAEHLRKLLTPVEGENFGIGYDKITEYRIRQIARTYEFTLRLLAYTLLAQLWEVWLNADSGKSEMTLKLSLESANKLRQLLRMTSQMQERFDYIGLIRETRRLLDESKVSYFVEELPRLRELLETNELFRDAIAYLEYLCEKVRNNNIQFFEVKELNMRGEESLADFFGELGFLARYGLTSVQNISVAKFRHERTAMFDHQVVLLRDLLGKLERLPQRLPDFLDNCSVLMRRIGKNAEGFLNLSPFIIDENAFESNTDVSKIFFYNHYDTVLDAYIFCYVNKPEDLISVPKTDKRIGILKTQLDAFLSIINANQIT